MCVHVYAYVYKETKEDEERKEEWMERLEVRQP